MNLPCHYRTCQITKWSQWGTLQATAILAWLLCTVPLSAAAPISFAEIQKHWKQRQELVKSGRFSWTETRFEAKGWKTPGETAAPRQDPPEDIRYTLECEMLFSENKWRYQFQKPKEGAQDGPGMVVLNDAQSAFNGDRSTKLLGPVGKRTFLQGEISHKDSGYRDVYSMPFFWAYRLPNRLLDYQLPADTVVTQQEGIIDGHSCIILENGDELDGKNVFWLDPLEGYLIRRYLFVQEGVSVIQVNIAYSQTSEEEGRWVPSQWTIVIRDTKKNPQVNTESKLTHWSINVPLDPALFTIPFPPGTIVYQDEHPKQFVQLENGKASPFTNKDIMKKNYTQLMDSIEGKKQAHYSNRWYIALLGLISIALLALWWLSRRVRRVSSGSRGGDR